MADITPDLSLAPPPGAPDSDCACDRLDFPFDRVLSLEKAQRMAEFFGVLGDPNRWRILSALALQSMRVRDLAAAVGMSESAVSHQLRILRTMRLVGYIKNGRNVIYSLKDQHIFNLYREASEHLDEPDDRR